MARRIFKYDPKLGQVVELTGPREIQRKAAKWPYESQGFAVGPEQIPEARDRWRKHAGINMEFTPTGEAIMTGPEMFKKACKTMGYVDRGSYYS